MKTELKIFSGIDAKKYLNQIANIRISMFKEFPYLYDGSLEYEINYLETYFKSHNSRILLIFSGDEIVGFSSAIPLAEEEDEVKKPFLDLNINCSELLYIGELMIMEKFRKQGYLRKFIEFHTEFARDNNFKALVFMAVDRGDNHPQKPKGYQHPDIIWKHFGFTPTNIFVDFSWKRIDTGADELNKLRIWRAEV